MAYKYNYKKIFSMIDKTELVSFDIFDTLIKRNITSPQDLFKKIQNIYNENENENISDFVENRKLMQKKARLSHLKDDYTINEVYQLLEEIYGKERTKKFLNLERELELKYCIRNFDFYPIYEYCVKKRKKIICISDMYFNKQFINQILINNGYDKLDKIYVSCDYRKRKAIGNLYDSVYNDYKIKKSKWLHIGDSFKSDFLQPKRKGIKSYHIETFLNNLDYLDKNEIKTLDDEIVYSIINNNVNKSTNNKIQKVGFEVFGPLLFGYMKWLSHLFKKNDIKKIFFCSRDMKLIYDLFKEYFPEFDSKYFYISRKSIRGAYLHINHSYEDFIELITEEELSIKQILNVLNVKENDVFEQMQKFNLQENSTVNFKNISKNFQDFYNSITDIIAKSNNDQYSIFMEYLEQEDFKENVGLVDTGWNATTQYCLSKLTDKVKINGFYLGLEEKAYKRINKEYLDAYIFNPDANQNFKDKINSFKIVFETIICHNINSVTGYEYKNNCIYPTFEEKNTDTAEYVEDVQYGIINSMKSILNFDKKLDIDMLFAISALDKFISNPSLIDSSIFIQLKNKNFEKEKISRGPQHKLVYYLFNPKKLYNEFHQSVWKIAYLKLLFKIKMPYYNIYILIKKRKDKKK